MNSIEYPIVIEGGKRIVYQFSKMTPRGPRYFLDTIEYTESLNFNSLHLNFLFPITLSEHERNSSPGIMAIRLPGYFAETVVGVIDTEDRLRMRFKDSDVLLHSSGKIHADKPQFECSFQSDSLRVVVKADLTKVATGTHRAGAGNLQIFERKTLVQECDIFIVWNEAL